MVPSLDTIVLTVGPNDTERLEALADAVLDVAVPSESEVVITHVFTQAEFQEVSTELGYADADISDIEAILNRHESVRYFKNIFDEADVAYSVRGVVGDISRGIIQVAEESNADRVIVSGRSRSAVGKAVFGSTAQTVLLEAPCPVTFVKPDENE